MKVLVYLSIGLTVGSLSGSLGIGGGVLLVPILICLCGFEPSRAAGTSLAVLMIPVCFPAAWKAFGQGRVDLEAALWIAAAFAVGAYGGASAVPYLPEPTLHLLFGFLLIVVGVRFVCAVLPETDCSMTGMTASVLAVVAACLAGRRQLGALTSWRAPDPRMDSSERIHDYHI